MDASFCVHILNEVGKQRAKEIAEAFDNLLNEIRAHVPVSRELSIVRTKLEEACFFAKKGMANVADNCQP